MAEQARPANYVGRSEDTAAEQARDGRLQLEARNAASSYRQKKAVRKAQLPYPTASGLRRLAAVAAVVTLIAIALRPR